MDSAPVTAGRSLIRTAPYASLALWGGRVAHGLRFATAAVDVSLDAPTGPVAVPRPHPGVSPAHPVLGSMSPAEESPTKALASGSAVPRVLLLAPTLFAESLGEQDLVTRLNLCGSAPGCGRWVSVAFGGWVSSLSADAWPAAAVRFSERHPTADLLDLGAGWLLLQMEIAEAVVRTDRACVLLNTEEAGGLLVGAPGPLH
ncbi:hypothetical protein [Frankia sp. QA3]|uniref:hypothetical protein n=1 Tax=Frankia sp. QA3 TaxID=710111 RepID=UPI0002E88B37|nr:hypothetical protein [Frankia sp. QA3]